MDSFLIAIAPLVTRTSVVGITKFGWKQWDRRVELHDVVTAVPLKQPRHLAEAFYTQPPAQTGERGESRSIYARAGRPLLLHGRITQVVDGLHRLCRPDQHFPIERRHHQMRAVTDPLQMSGLLHMKHGPFRFG